MSKAAQALRVLLLLLLIASVSKTVTGASALSGVVLDHNGYPVPEARVRVYFNSREVASTITGVDGFFALSPPGETVELMVVGDFVDTEGMDFIPYSAEVTSSADVVVRLQPASVVSLVGSIQFVDTENLALQLVVNVVDENNETLSPSGVPLEFGRTSGSVMTRLQLPLGQIIVPAETAVRLKVDSTFLLGTDVTPRGFTAELARTAPQGGVVALDVRRYSLLLNQRITEESQIALSDALEEMTKYGFYITRQEAAYVSGSKLLEESLRLYKESSYPDSFDAMKRSFLAFTHSTEELTSMFKDARLSVYLLIGFLALASMTGGFLLADDRLRQLSADAAIYVVTLLVLYFTYPGSKIISLEYYVGAAVASFAGFLVLGYVTPRVLSVGSVDGRVHTRNLLIPIFNIAKRSLRRRRVRFILTLTSITLLVMSFVTLTSFSEGYGLIETRSLAGGPWTGVFIRDGSWAEAEPTFILLSATETAWLTDLPTVQGLSVKAESLPQQRPFLRLMGTPIAGVIGAGSSEDNTVAIRSALLQGRLPDSGGVLISSSLAERLGVDLGDVVEVGFIDLEIQGTFRDESLAVMRDLDGTPYLPNRWVNTNPEGETPVWVLEPCEPQETIILAPETAVRLPMVGVQRVALELSLGADPDALAERLALERGYTSYSSTLSSYAVYRLGNFFEGRGLTLAIPWGIVVLNVVVTMLNALYERRKEIEILSSVGLNPAQVSAIFVAEASITGFMAGGLGYLMGLSLYKGMAALNIGLQVHQKVSAVWSMASIGLAISAVLTGAFAALRSSVVITPSLMRRWRIDRTKGGFQDPWTVAIPLKLQPEEVKPYMDYMYEKLGRLQSHPTQITSSIKRFEDGDVKKITFIYKSVQATTGNFYTVNELVVAPHPNGEYGAELKSLGNHDWVHVAGTLIRRLTMDFSTDKLS
ncbi:MAG: FtsX-like permease family protein [Candidatus Bathyarchaeota archaeon]